MTRGVRRLRPLTETSEMTHWRLIDNNARAWAREETERAFSSMIFTVEVAKAALAYFEARRLEYHANNGTQVTPPEA